MTSQARTKPEPRTVCDPPRFDLLTLLLLFCRSYAADRIPCRTEKQKLLAATSIEAATPTTFQGFENLQIQLPMAYAQPCSAMASAQAFATGAVAVALPAPASAPVQAAIPRALSRLPDGGQLRGR